MSPRRYREIYRREGQDQAAISGYELSMSALKTGSGNYGWQVETTIDGARSRSVIEVLMWSDIVQASMDRSIPYTFLLLVRTAKW